MGLFVRVNALIGVCVIALTAAAGYFCHSILEANAKRELIAEASLMLDSATAIRTYTSSEILPLLNKSLATEFHPQSVPFYAATQNFLKLHEKFPQYTYKEATLNPTNLRDRATDWEADVIQKFRNDLSVHELVGFRDSAMGSSLYMARAIRVETECLSCHSTPASAPASLVARYGSSNGFDWQSNEIVGAQIISVPYSRASDAVARSFAGFMGLIVVSFIALWLIVDAILFTQLIQPIRKIIRVADTLSLGRRTAEVFPQTGPREITALGDAFNRMRRSLEKASKLLGG